ncbi:hypothetical protein [Krasilnikovia sp. M28-CT-15]
MSDRQLRTQHDEVIGRNQAARLATMAEARRQAEARNRRRGC